MVCCDSLNRRVEGGLSRIEIEGGRVWVATSCTVVCRAAAVGTG